MRTEIQVPVLGESISEATIAQWYKKAGDAVRADEPLCELETDKVTIEVPAPASGVLVEIIAGDGETVTIGAVLGAIDAAGATPKAAQSKAEPAPQPEPQPQPAAPAPEAPQEISDNADVLPPSVRKLIDEHGLDPSRIAGTGKGGRLTKADVLNVIAGGGDVADAPAPAPQSAPAPSASSSVPTKTKSDSKNREERVRMTRLRKTIAKRLKDSQNTAAMLTTFNEVDMSVLMAARSEHKEAFEKRHGVKLGFMGFFVRACMTALHEIPSVNAEIDGDELVYKNYVNMGIAVGTDKGLVVPVLRDVQNLSLAEIEMAIADYATRARDGNLAIEDLQGGTFTISNGGVYGSLMSTPILNSPQSGILGMHKIQDRPIAVDGEVVIRPMMYLALSYDHRIVDGREAVTFLLRVKEGLENPELLLLNM